MNAHLLLKSEKKQKNIKEIRLTEPLNHRLPLLVFSIHVHIFTWLIPHLILNFTLLIHFPKWIFTKNSE